MVSELRKVIEQKTNVPFDRQRLIYKAKLLVDDQPLSTYGEYFLSFINFLVKESGETLHLVKKPAPEQAPPTTSASQSQQSVP
jgi:hypothetical protein